MFADRKECNSLVVHTISHWFSCIGKCYNAVLLVLNQSSQK